MDRKLDDIEKSIDATRERLVANVEEIADRLTPEEIAKRTVGRAQDSAKRAYGQVKAYYVDDVSGEVRQERALKTGAIALGLLVLRKLLK